MRKKDRLYRLLLLTAVARGIAAIGGVALVFYLGRNYGPEGVALFSVCQSLVLGGAIISRYGMNNSLMRFIGMNLEKKELASLIGYAFRAAIFLSICFILIANITKEYWVSFFGGVDLRDVALPMFITLPAFTLAMILAGVMKGLHRPALACLLESGSISFVTLILVFLAGFAGVNGSAEIAVWCFSFAAWIIFGHGYFELPEWAKYASAQKVERVLLGRFRKSSGDLFVLSLAIFMQQVVSMIICAGLLDAKDFGLFKAAERVALVVSFSLMVINSVFPPRFSRLHHAQDYDALKGLAKKSTLYGAIISSPLAVVCLVFPSDILELFGADFVQAENMLRIIAIAQFLNAATGSTNFLLNMTGHERLMRNIALSTNIVALSLFFILIPFYGALGAAASLAILIILQNIVSFAYVRVKLGFWMVPFYGK